MSSYKLPENRIQTDQRQSFVATVPIGSDDSIVLDPSFWAHTARKLTPGDEVVVVPDGLAWYARFFVIDRGDNWAKVARVAFADLSQAEISADTMVDQFEIAWKGPTWLFTVSRAGSKDEPIAKGFKTRADANRWVLENGRTVAKAPAAA